MGAPYPIMSGPWLRPLGQRWSSCACSMGPTSTSPDPPSSSPSRCRGCCRWPGSRRRIPQMSDICEIRKVRGVHGRTLSLIQIPPKRPCVSRRQLPRPGPVLGAHAEPGAAADLVEVVVQAAGLLADYELLAHGLQVLSDQPPPTVSHASSSRRKSTDHPKPNPTPQQRQWLML